jgi:hypothetical protein
MLKPFDSMSSFKYIKNISNLQGIGDQSVPHDPQIGRWQASGYWAARISEKLQLST